MLDFIGNSISISSGMELKLSIPVDVQTSRGKFALKGKHPLTGEVELINGFGTKYPEVGKVSLIKDEEPGAIVLYKHEKSQLNTIWFFALTGEIGVLDIIAVPIHDHSTVVQGGPAYGTYFSEYT